MLGPLTMSLASAGALLVAAISPLGGTTGRMVGPTAPPTLGLQQDALTGCLHSGDEDGEFHFTTKDGKTYDVKGMTVPLAKHVGHTVSITGKPVEAEPGENHQEEGEAGEFEVTAMKHLSESCQMK